MSRKRMGAVACAAVAALGSVASAQVTMSPLMSWGTNGWLAPGAQPYVTTTNAQRSMAFNPVTGNLLLANDLSVRVLNPSTGASVALMDVTGIAGGARALNTVGVTTDGVIYGTNLVSPSSATSPFRVYRWADQSAAPVQVYAGDAGLLGARVGDSFAVFGSDASGRMAAGFGSSPTIAGNNSFSYLTTGLAPTATAITLPTPPVAGDFRLGITFVNATTVLGTQGQASGNGLRVVSITGSSGTLDDTSILSSTSERGLGYAVVGGLPLLATIDSVSSLVRVYDMTDLTNPVLLVSGNNTTGTLAPNGNGTVAIAWGNISGNTATLYAMSTNQGIQAFTVVVPEPAALGLLAPAALLLGRRRQA